MAKLEEYIKTPSSGGEVTNNPEVLSNHENRIASLEGALAAAITALNGGSNADPYTPAEEPVAPVVGGGSGGGGSLMAAASLTAEGGFVPAPSSTNEMLAWTNNLTDDVAIVEFELIDSKAGDEVWFTLRNTELVAIDSNAVLPSTTITFITDHRVFAGSSQVKSNNNLTWPTTGVVAYVVDFAQREVRFYKDGTLAATLDFSESHGYSNDVFSNRDKAALGLQGQGSGVNTDSIRVRTDPSTFIHNYS